jgi:hypothetical protein
MKNEAANAMICACERDGELGCASEAGTKLVLPPLRILSSRKEGGAASGVRFCPASLAGTKLVLPPLRILSSRKEGGAALAPAKLVLPPLRILSSRKEGGAALAPLAQIKVVKRPL